MTKEDEILKELVEIKLIIKKLSDETPKANNSLTYKTKAKPEAISLKIGLSGAEWKVEKMINNIKSTSLWLNEIIMNYQMQAKT